MAAKKAETGEFKGTERFEVIRAIGAGGMGVVFEALDRERNVKVALKSLRSLSAEGVLRFKNEFRALQDIQHPNLVTLGELVEDHGRWFFTMELVEGRHFLAYLRPDLADKAVAKEQELAEGAAGEESPTLDLPVPPEGGSRVSRLPGPPVPGLDTDKVRAALAQLVQGLSALHAANKVHRDVKPSNILVTAEGRVVVLDFGVIADMTVREEEKLFVGTAAYMAPEQTEGRGVGPEADWYSVGVILYQALTGRLPLIGNMREVLVMKRTFEPAPPRLLAPGVPEDLDQLCVDLLHIDPRTRPTSREILRRLNPRDPVESGRAPPGAPVPHFIGRRGEIEQLRAAFAEVRASGALTVLLHGESGVGKSSITRRFARIVPEQAPDTLILAGRCYERESVPYKAVDGIIDAMSRYLTGVDAGALLPRQRGLLGQVFPVMRRVRAVAEAPRQGIEALDPLILRTRLFVALRELMGRIAEQRPLVLLIDDLQWADADSLALLEAMMRPPDAPRLLLIATMRTSLRTSSRTEAGARTVQQVREALSGPIRTLAVENLDTKDAEALVSALLRDAGIELGASVQGIAQEAGGHPLFIDELVRTRMILGAETGPVRLDDALWARIDLLDTPSRTLLELVAVAGTPLLQELAAEAAGTDFGAFAAQIAVLRGTNLVRTSGARRTDTIEPYHDRVREAVLHRLDTDEQKGRHERLALALEATGTADPETLASHWLGAGNPGKAFEHTLHAASRAVTALAFDRAARLYQAAIELHPGEDAAGMELRADLGNALVNAGRGAEAAKAYLAAAALAEGSKALDLRRLSAEQLLRSGLVEEGVAEMGKVLASVGIELPKSPQRALAALLLRRAQVRVRGLDFKVRDPSQVPAATLNRVDICWSVSAALGMVDVIRGADFQSRGLLLALDAGEPYRVARALCAEAAYSATAGGAGRKRTDALLALARTRALEVGRPYPMAWATLADGLAAFLVGEWRRAYDSCVRAEEIFRGQCAGARWEIATAQARTALSLFYLGEMDELCRVVALSQREAQDRGDLYAMSHATTGFPLFAWLSQDDPAGGRRAMEETMRQESAQEGFRLVHYRTLLGHAQLDLYEGNARAAHDRVVEQWPELRRSMMLRVQLLNVQSLHLRARTALAAATTQVPDRDRLLREVEHDASAIEDEKMPYAAPMAALARAGVAAMRGKPAAALQLLDAAAQGFDAAGMRLYAAIARRRKGQLLGGDGRALVGEADAWMGQRGIKDPIRMSAVLAPGFPVLAPGFPVIAPV